MVRRLISVHPSDSFKSPFFLQFWFPNRKIFKFIFKPKKTLLVCNVIYFQFGIEIQMRRRMFPRNLLDDKQESEGLAKIDLTKIIPAVIVLSIGLALAMLTFLAEVLFKGLQTKTLQTNTLPSRALPNKTVQHIPIQQTDPNYERIITPPTPFM